MVKSLGHPLFFLRLPSNAFPDIGSVGEPGGTVPNKISRSTPRGSNPFQQALEPHRKNWDKTLGF